MTISQLTSLSLLDRLQEPDNNIAWEIFLTIYRPFILKQLQRAGIDHPDVDDLLQESLAEMLVALPRFNHNGQTGAFRKWMRTIIVRKASRILRKSRKSKHAQYKEVKSVEQLDQSLQQLIDREHDEHVVQSLLGVIRPEFTDTTWTAFELQVVQGRTASDVAEQLGVTSNSVLICKSRVMRRLRLLAKGLVEC